MTTAADKLLAAGYHAVFSDRKEAMFAKMNPTVRARIEREREAVAAGVSGGGTSQDIGGGARAEGGGVEGRGGAGRMWEYRLEVDQAAIPSVEIASMSVSMRACVRACMHACVRVFVCVYIYLHRYIYRHMHTCLCVCADTFIHALMLHTRVLRRFTLHCTWARMLATHNYKKAHVRARTHTHKACTLIH